MANIGDLKAAIAGYANRNVADYVHPAVGGADLLLRGINNAKNYAQRAIEFNLALLFLQVENVTPTGGGDLSTAFEYGDGTKTVVPIRSLKRAWLAFADASGQFPIPIVSRDMYVARVQRRYAGMVDREYDAGDSLTPPEFMCQQVGTKIYITPANEIALGSSFSVYFDAFKWIADFTADNNTHFLVDFCFDFLMFRAMWEMNFFMKEDERFNVTEKMLSDYWNNIVQWNATVIGSNIDDMSLD